jgi:hypothetical protein
LEPQTENKSRVRARKITKYEVEICDDLTKPTWLLVGQHSRFDAMPAATKFIKTHGVEGKHYRIVRVVAGPFTIATETVTRRKLT